MTSARQAAGTMWGGRTGALLRALGWGRPTGVPGRRLRNCNAASVAGSSSPRCWNCGGLGGPPRGDRFFCPQCRALQPPDPTRDYFSLMDWYGGRFLKRVWTCEEGGRVGLGEEEGWTSHTGWRGPGGPGWGWSLVEKGAWDVSGEEIKGLA